MPARIDITGHKFGRWVVLRHESGRKWSCRCDCGFETPVDAGSLRSGRSAGCIRCHTSTRPARKHGQKRTRLYNIWSRMKGRCGNPNDAAFPRYGGRGLSVCQEWADCFEAFAAWAAETGYAEHLTIDRKDNNGDYRPDNCRWATYAEQNRNYSRNRPIEYRGRTVLICDLAVEVGLPQDVLKNRILRYGWDVERAVAEPVAKRTRQAISFTTEQRNIDHAG